MKKRKLLVGALMLGVIALTACGENGNSTISVTPITTPVESIPSQTTTHEHTYGEWIVVMTATETEKGLQKRICSVCGYEEDAEIDLLPHTHKYEEAWSYDAEKHWHEATCGHDVKNGEVEHTYGEWIVVTPSTEGTKGLQKRTCSVCGYEEDAEIDLLPHTHKYEETWSVNETSHWHASTCGHDVKNEESAHTYGEWIVVTPSTEIEKGLQKRTCLVCGYEDEKEMDLLPHTHKYEETWSTNETSHWHASTCQHDIQGDYSEHVFSDWTIIVQASCKSDGSQERICLICDYKETMIINATHTFDDGICIICGALKPTDGIEYSLVSWNNYCVSGVSNDIKENVTNLIIADLYNGKPVVNIGNAAFKGCCHLVNVSIPNSIINIEDNAFENCSRLKKIIIPQSVISIGESAFLNCSSLNEIEFSTNIKSIGYMALNGCANLQSLTIPFVGTGLTSTRYLHPFGYIFGKKNYYGSKATSQYDYDTQYENRTNKDTYYIPTTLKNVTLLGGTIFMGCFFNCDTLTVIALPDGITSIDKYAFYNCTNLLSIKLPNSVNSIGSNAFYNCSSLSNIDIPEKVSILSEYVFYNCSSLLNVVIPAGVTKIDTSAFENCISMSWVILPDSIREIGSKSFIGCDKLKKIFYLGTKKQWQNISKVLYPTTPISSSESKRYYYSETQLTDTDDLYWHYVNGVPTPW